MRTILIFFCVIFFVSRLYASDIDRSNHDHGNHIYAPAMVMGDHPHSKGEWMLSYRYGEMYMEGNRNGNSDVATDVVLDSFMVAPLRMDMKMHMFSVMYGVNDKLTFMGMLPYKILSMDHVNRMGVNFTTKSEGIGDAKLTGLYTLYHEGNKKFLLNGGISIPTGGVDKRDDMPTGSNQKLPYPMQLGSGTYDVLPSVTYTDYFGLWSVGTQLNMVVHLGDNDRNYRLGDSYNLTFWGGRKINNFTSIFVRLDGKAWEDINGADDQLNPMMVATARSDLRAGKTIDFLLGIDFVVPGVKFKNQRFLIEGGVPLYQNLDGPQLKNDYKITAGWQLLL